MNSELSIIIAAGGSGTRFGGDKLLRGFRDMPLLCHCLKNFDAPERQFILAVPARAISEYRSVISSYINDFKGIITLVAGGSSRMASVSNAFAALEEQSDWPEFVAIHDAARPLADMALLERCVAAARECGAGIAAHRVTDTIHQADQAEYLLGTPQRDTLWAAETPQVFKTEIYARALREIDWRTTPPTDDAQLVSQLPGIRVRLVENSAPNPKITFPHDLELFESL